MNIKYFIEGEQIDLFDNEAINYRGKLIDAQDITALFSDFVNTFSIPATPKNNRIFKNWYEIGVDNGFNPNLRIPSTLEYNTLPFRFGKTQLEEVREKNGKSYSYRITFYSEITGLSERFGDDTLADLEGLDNYNFSYSEQNIKALFESPSLVITEGDLSRKPNLVMPMILPVGRDVQYGTGLKNDITTEAGRLYLENFRPAINKARIIEAIEDKYGIQFSRDFIDSSDFSSLFMWLNREKEYDNVIGYKTVPLPKNFQVNNRPTNPVDVEIGTDVKGDYFRVTRSTEIVNNSTASGPEVEYGIKFRIAISSPNNPTQFDFRVVDENNNVVKEARTLNTGSQRSASTIPNVVIIPTAEEEAVTITSKYYLQIRPKDEIDGTYTYAISTNIGGSFNTETNIISNNLPIKSVPEFKIRENIPNMTVSKYIKNLIKEFKLIIRPNSINNFKLQTINDYYASSKELDITNITDVDSVETKVYKNNKSIDYKFKVSEDVSVVKNFQRRTGRFRGNNKVEFNLDEKKNTEIDIDFEVPYFVRLGDTQNDVATRINLALYSEFKDGSYEAIETDNVVQFYYIGLSGVSPSRNEDTNKPFLLDLNNKPDEDEENPVINTIEISTTAICDSSNNAFFSQVSNNLDFSDTTFNGWHSVPIEKNIYNVNHKPWIDNLINNDNRLVSLESNLGTQDLIDLDLDTQIIYKNNKYNIEEYNAELTSNKVEFTLFPNFSNRFETTNDQISSTSFLYGYGGGYGNLEVQTNKQLSIVSENDWIEVININENNNKYKILFFVEERYLTTGRNGDLTLTLGSTNYEISVFQGQRDSSLSGGSLSITPTTYNVDFEEESKTISVFSDTFWEVKNLPNGITVDRDFGYGDDVITMTIEEYSGFNARTLNFQIGTIFQTGGTTITVNQAPEPVLNIVQTNITGSQNAQSLFFDVVSNVSYTVTDNQGWITIPTSAHSGSKQIEIQIDENITINERVGVVTVTNSANGLSDTVQVTQEEGVPFINVSPSDFETNFRETTLSVDVQSNVPFVVNTVDSWITVNQTSGNGNQTITLDIDLNMGGLRNGSISIENATFGLSEIIPITQEAFVNPPPSTPTNLTGNITYSTSGDVITLSWDASNSKFFNIDFYEVRRSVDFGNFTQIGTSQHPSVNYQDFDIDGGKNYRYRIRAVDTEGDKSSFSSISQVFDVQTTLSINTTSKNVGQGSGSFPIELYTNTSWASNNLGFTSLSPSSGNGNTTVNVSYSANQNINTRQQILEFSAGDKGVNLTINQEAFIEELTVNKTDVNLTNGGGSFTFTITSNTEWSITKTSNISGWLTFSKLSGSGNDTIVVNYPQNLSIVELEGQIKIVTGQGSVQRNIDITQEGFIEELTLSSYSSTRPSSSGSFSIALNSNTNWTISDNRAWVTTSPTSGSGNATITINRTLNQLLSERDGTITFTTGQGSVTRTYNLTQEGFVETLSVSPNVINAGQNAGSATININSNTVTDATDNRSWLSVSPQSGTGNRTATVSWGNNSFGARSGVVTVSTGLNSKSETITVNQDAYVPPFDVNPKNISYTYTGGNKTITVDGNDTWNISGLPIWLTSSKGSQGTGNFTLTANTNTSNLSRSFSVNITADGISKTINVSQDGNPETVSVSPTSTNVSSGSGSTNVNVSTNTNVTITSAQNWITHPSSLSTSGSISINYNTNNNTSSRSGTVIFETPNGVTALFTLNQAGTPSSYSFTGKRGNSKTTVCDDFGTNVTVYSSSANPSVGDILYQDSNLNNPVNNSDTFYKFAFDTIYEVNFNAEISKITSC